MLSNAGKSTFKITFIVFKITGFCLTGRVPTGIHFTAIGARTTWKIWINQRIKKAPLYGGAVTAFVDYYSLNLELANQYFQRFGQLVQLITRRGGLL